MPTEFRTDDGGTRVAESAAAPGGEARLESDPVGSDGDPNRHSMSAYARLKEGAEKPLGFRQ